MEASVLGCRLPRVSRCASIASRYSGSASSYLPWAFSSEASVLRVKLMALPSVRLTWSRALSSSMLSASRYSSLHWPQRTDGEATISTLDTLATELQAQGKYDEAEPLYRETLEVERETLGDRHPHTLISINNLGGLLQSKGDLAAAEPLCREALEAQRETLGNRHPSTLTSRNRLGALLQKMDDLTFTEG